MFLCSRCEALVSGRFRDLASPRGADGLSSLPPPPGSASCQHFGKRTTDKSVRRLRPAPALSPPGCPRQQAPLHRGIIRSSQRFSPPPELAARGPSAGLHAVSSGRVEPQASSFPVFGCGNGAVSWRLACPVAFCSRRSCRPRSYASSFFRCPLTPCFYASPPLSGAHTGHPLRILGSTATVAARKHATNGADQRNFSDCRHRPLKAAVSGYFGFNSSFHFELKQQLCSISD